MEESVGVIAQYKQQLIDLQQQREAASTEIDDRWSRVANEITEVTINPKKTDIFVNLFGVAWVPYYIVQSDAETLELPAFGSE